MSLLGPMPSDDKVHEAKLLPDNDAVFLSTVKSATDKKLSTDQSLGVFEIE